MGMRLFYELSDLPIERQVCEGGVGNVLRLLFMIAGKMMESKRPAITY